MIVTDVTRYDDADGTRYSIEIDTTERAATWRRRSLDVFTLPDHVRAELVKWLIADSQTEVVNSGGEVSVKITSNIDEVVADIERKLSQTDLKLNLGVA